MIASPPPPLPYQVAASAIVRFMKPSYISKVYRYKKVKVTSCWRSKRSSSTVYCDVSFSRPIQGETDCQVISGELSCITSTLIPESDTMVKTVIVKRVGTTTRVYDCDCLWSPYSSRAPRWHP